MHKKLRVHRPQAAGLLRVRNLMFSAFAYKGDSLRAYFNGLGEAVETSRGKKTKDKQKKKQNGKNGKLEGCGKIFCASGKIFAVPILLRNI